MCTCLLSALILAHSSLSSLLLCLLLLPSVGWPVDAAWYSSTFIAAAHEPEMIYALPLTSLSPSSSPSTLTSFSPLPVLPPFITSSPIPPSPFFHLLVYKCSLFLLLCSNSPPSPLYRVPCPTEIRVAQQTTSATARRGKLKRRSSWQTMWGHFHNTLKCLSYCRKVLPNSSNLSQIKEMLSL